MNILTKQDCDYCKKITDFNDENRCLECIEKKCFKIGCKFKRSIENKYCKKHQSQILLDALSKDKKYCGNFIRGCRTIMDINDSFVKCEECRLKSKLKDKELLNKKKAVVVEEGFKIC